MYTNILFATVSLLAVGNCYPGLAGGTLDGHGYRKPGPGDRRSPCPMVNSLANHAFVARSGKNISVDEMVNAIDVALNLSPLSSRPVVETAATTSTTGYPNTFNLDDLKQHGVIEHDSSLSRNDVFFGDNHRFDEVIYATTAAGLSAGGPVVSIATAARVRRARNRAARAVNPQFEFTPREDTFSQFESALYLAVFGNGTQGDAPMRWVDIMFREERIPYNEGYRRPTRMISNDDILELASKVAAAAPIFT
ncbi:Chloroperoxidase [Podospora didyma]|uniref:Chloroperoxidase n=1 Tax=Podospora didyma TaxID=330526 RepID=A0AAE0U1T6_9PEZI|nr:Chloroperoxidase [Podospora didyma]